MADINGDGTVDVFDLIVLKKKIISSMTEAPKPVMVDISENFAWSIHQNVTVYDQYGTAYSFKLSDSHNNYEKYNKENILINMDSDNWYEQILDIMDKANQSASENTKDESKSKQQIVYKKTVNALQLMLNTLLTGEATVASEIHLLDPAYYLQNIPVTIPCTELLVIAVGTLLLSLLASTVPAIRAGREKPIDTLRKM